MRSANDILETIRVEFERVSESFNIKSGNIRISLKNILDPNDGEIIGYLKDDQFYHRMSILDINRSDRNWFILKPILSKLSSAESKLLGRYIRKDKDISEIKLKIKPYTNLSTEVEREHFIGILNAMVYYEKHSVKGLKVFNKDNYEYDIYFDHNDVSPIHLNSSSTALRIAIKKFGMDRFDKAFKDFRMKPLILII